MSFYKLSAFVRANDLPPVVDSFVQPIRSIIDNFLVIDYRLTGDTAEGFQAFLVLRLDRELEFLDVGGFKILFNNGLDPLSDAARCEVSISFEFPLGKVLKFYPNGDLPTLASLGSDNLLILDFFGKYFVIDELELLERAYGNYYDDQDFLLFQIDFNNYYNLSPKISEVEGYDQLLQKEIH